MKKKRWIVLLIIGLLVLAGVACGGSGSSEEEPAETGTETTENNDAEDEDTAVEEADAEDDADADSDSGDSALLSPEFKKTMDDYEAWFDHYCEVMKKYQENPSDLGLLSEMSDLMAEETTMLDQMENMDESEMNAAELAYYLEVTARIEKKLLEVADY